MICHGMISADVRTKLTMPCGYICSASCAILCVLCLVDLPGSRPSAKAFFDPRKPQPCALLLAQIAHPSFFVGLLLRGAALPYANYGHVVLAQPSPVLFYPISSTEVRLNPSLSNLKLRF